ncbi:hypothetical protein CB0940_02499 [Cercospora beticola]|uniref:DUF6536 domain-containing protein n=1 Tax=Cercospora beticola TaxID=122368 RepID=A0A2G5I4S9_CERBT|nr:hypothetical protein CB0940_02499 [Cercospora beticola]PIA99817.1 hypothetical protein CB0940_02499 [Cercospora beticola]WPA99638.1 hypothetical protein RHO25_004256 [Cercospora beticola]
MTVIYHVLDQHAQVKDEFAEENKIESGIRRKGFSRWQSWGVTITAGATTAAIVLTINIWVFTYVALQFKIEDGIATIYRGTCTVTSNISTYGHLLINILGTLLLGASNAGAQLLSAPTRSDVARAHSKNRWMDIGVPSLRGLRTIPRWRRSGWVVLMMSSIPLHLLYNSVLFTTSARHDYVASLVAPDFFETSRGFDDMKIPEEIKGSTSFPDESVVDAFWTTRNLALQGNLTRLSKRECLIAYGATNAAESDKENLLVVTKPINDVEFGTLIQGNKTFAVLPLLDLFIHKAEDQFNDLDWRCGGSLGSGNAINTTCGEHKLVPAYKDDAGEWPIRTYLYQCNDGWRTIPDCIKENWSSCVSPWIDRCNMTRTTVEVDYCLAAQSPGKCTAKVSLSLLAVVMGCNVVKVLVLCAMAGMNLKSFKPLVTIGDAVKYFLEEPEDSAKGRGPISVMDVVAPGRTPTTWQRPGVRIVHVPIQDEGGGAGAVSRTGEVGTSRSKPAPFIQESDHWWRTPSVGLFSPWKICLFLCVIMWLVAACMIAVAFLDDGISSESKLNFKDFNFSSLVGLPESASLSLYIIVPNIPQLLVSFAYVFYNNSLTCMLLTYETTQFATKRKFLRVSDPEGQQKSTYWLQLPYQYSIPLLSTMALLHWLISRSLFFKAVEYYDPAGEMSEESYTACAFSPLALILSCSLGALLILVFCALSLRKVHRGMPLMGSCSIAISAACANCGEGGEAAMKALMYGVLTTGTDEQQQGTKRVGFSQYEVEPLQGRTKYL